MMQATTALRPYFWWAAVFLLSSCVSSYQSFTQQANKGIYQVNAKSDLPLKPHKNEVEIYTRGNQPDDPQYLEISSFTIPNLAQLSYWDKMKRVQSRAQTLGYDAVIDLHETNIYDDGIPSNVITGTGIKFLKNIDYLHEFASEIHMFVPDEGTGLKQIASLELNLAGKTQKVNGYASYWDEIQQYSLDHLVHETKNWKFKTNEAGRVTRRVLVKRVLKSELYEIEQRVKTVQLIYGKEEPVLERLLITYPSNSFKDTVLISYNEMGKVKEKVVKKPVEHVREVYTYNDEGKLLQVDFHRIRPSYGDERFFLQLRYQYYPEDLVLYTYDKKRLVVLPPGSVLPAPGVVPPTMPVEEGNNQLTITQTRFNSTNRLGELKTDITTNELAEPSVRRETPAAAPAVYQSDIARSLPRDVRKNPDAVAVVIGNKDYQHKDIPSVQFAHRDAALMKKYLTETFGFKPENILYMENASLAGFVSVFGSKDNHRGRLFNYLKPGSDVFIYYTGHGAPELQQKQGYFVPSDADPSLVGLSGYPVAQLFENLSKTPYKSLTVLIDACFNGASDAGMIVQEASPVFIKSEIRVLNDPRNAIFISSAGDQVSSWFSQEQHSLFTYFFLKGIQGAADDNKDGVVTLTELKDYLDKEVTFKARRLHNREQYPDVYGEPDRVMIQYQQR
jgi:hypothetical protein